MRQISLKFIFTNLLSLMSIFVATSNFDVQAGASELLRLPEPKLDGSIAVEEALHRCRSVREYQSGELTLAEISQLMWAGQGITDPRGFRTAPSAGALYPLELSLIVGEVSGLATGVYRYKPKEHALWLISKTDLRVSLTRASWQQDIIKDAAALLVISGIYQRTTKKYGDRGIRYVHMEAGHTAQNIFLQATALGLSMVVIGAFDDELVKKILDFSDQEHPLYLIPVGK